ncbi:amidohydrolase [Pseudoxanthomonas sp.]|uniref:amidohydrolase n=1 Tax=Pseudoxanthomonas sp. TaxID=1871049 RepID=UPI003F7E1D97
MCMACNPGAAEFLRMRRNVIGGMVGLGMGAWLGGTSPARAFAGKGDADTIFHNGPILTLAGHGRAEAVAVRDGRIAAVGARAEVNALRGPRTRIIDLAGRALLPGFVDPHMHSAMAILAEWLDLTAFTTPTLADALSKVGNAARRARPGEWVIGQGIDPSLMPGEPLTRRSLDEAAPENPVFILESNGHVGYANSAALALAGIGAERPDPPQGRYVRVDGELTGRLEESPAFKPIMAVMPMPDAKRFVALTRRLFDEAAAAGCTSLHDAGIGGGGVQDLDALDAVMAANPPVRYSGFLTSDLMDDWVARGLKPGHGGDRFRLTGIKFWSDGSNQARTGYQREPYIGTDSRGALNYTREALIEGVQRAHDLGWQVGIHANGDAAIDTTLDVYEAVLRKSPRRDHRHRIEHCSLLHGDQIRRMRQLELSPSFLIGHIHYWGRAFRDDILGPERANLYDPCASALKGGLRISLHSDFNVTTIEPLRYIDNAVNRKMRDGGEVLNPSECITVEQALRAVTIDAAWQCRIDDITGSLEPGKYADFVILDRDPTAVRPEEVGMLAVRETWLQGVRRYPHPD